MSSTLDAVCGLARAAVRRGHAVTIFTHMGGVSLLEASRATKSLVCLIPLGVRLLSCRTSATERGIEDSLMEGTEMSSLSELVELLDRCDRAVFLG